MRIEGRLENGAAEGIFRAFLSSDGKEYVINETRFAHGKKDGATVAYYPGIDRIYYRGAFRNGVRDGEFSFFHQNGTLGVRLSYDMDQLAGRCEVFDSAGRQIASGVYEKDVPKVGTFVSEPERFCNRSRMYPHRKPEVFAAAKK